MPIYRVKDVGNGLASFFGTTVYPEFARFGFFDAAGPVTFAASWKPPLLDVHDQDFPLPDWGFALPKLPIVSERAVDTWAGLLIGCAEVLPVQLKGRTDRYYTLNIFSTNGLDMAKSRFAIWEATPGRLRAVTRVVFCEDVTANLFVLRYFPGTYCSEQVRDRANSTGLLGFECTEQLEVP